MIRFFVFLLFLGVAAAAFYGGMRYQKSLPATSADAAAAQSAQTAAEAAKAADFDRQRIAVDGDDFGSVSESLQQFPGGDFPRRQNHDARNSRARCVSSC